MVGALAEMVRYLTIRDQREEHGPGDSAFDLSAPPAIEVAAILLGRPALLFI